MHFASPRTSNSAGFQCRSPDSSYAASREFNSKYSKESSRGGSNSDQSGSRLGPRIFSRKGCKSED